MAEMRIVRDTDRFDECCHFYGEVLGWPTSTGWDDHGRGRIFAFGDSARVEFLEVPAGAAHAPRGVSVSVEVDDVAAVHDALVASGIEISQPVANQPWGHRSVGVVDPTGMDVVLFQVLD